MPLPAEPRNPLSPDNLSELRISRPMNILEVASHFPEWGGTELHLLNLSEQLVARGHRVTVIARPGRFVEREAQRRGLRTVAATVVRQQDWHDRKIFARLMKSEHFDIVHAHWRPDYMVAPTIARLNGVPVNLLSHHSPHPLKKKEVFLYPRFLYNRLIALSESVRQMLIGIGMPPEKVVTIHHGTDTRAFVQTTIPPQEVRAAWNVPQGHLLVGIVGRVSEEKGIVEFLHALSRLKNRPIHGVVVGNGYQDLLVRHIHYSLNLTNVTLSGFRNDVNNAINALDALVLASTWAEPCAAVVQQAMALGKPVIGTRMGGTPEMIAEGETGLLIPPSDVDALTESLESLLAMSPEMRNTMGAKGTERVEAHFTLNGMVDKIESLYYRELMLRTGSNFVSGTTIQPPRTGTVAHGK